MRVEEGALLWGERRRTGYGWQAAESRWLREKAVLRALMSEGAFLEALP